jgi:uncharacterized lipoprotein YmbA
MRWIGRKSSLTPARIVDVLDYDRWVAPLSDLLGRTLAANLSARLGAGTVADPGLAVTLPDVRRIAVSILAFEPSRQGACLVEASWAIADGGTPRAARVETHRSRRAAVATGPRVEDMVVTMSGLVAAIAEDIAASLTPGK